MDHIKTETSSIICILNFFEGPFCQKLPEFEWNSKTVGGKTAVHKQVAQVAVKQSGSVSMEVESCH